MNALIRHVSIWIFVIAQTCSVHAQSEDSVLIYEVGAFPCDGFRGTIDILLSELRANSGWDGIVVNVGRGKGELLAVIREEMIRTHVSFRGFEPQRIAYFRSAGDEFKTKYLRVLSTPGRQSSHMRNYALTSVLEPVDIEDYEFDDLCPAIDYMNLFATLLEHNPDSRATILIRGKTIENARRKQQEVSRYLFSKRKILSSRIKVFLTEKQDFNYGNDPVVEYRYIP